MREPRSIVTLFIAPLLAARGASSGTSAAE
jgi:hypothetical protein